MYTNIYTFIYIFVSLHICMHTYRDIKVQRSKRQSPSSDSTRRSNETYMLKRVTYRKRDKEKKSRINDSIRRLDIGESAQRDISRQKVFENPSRAHTEAHEKTDGETIRQPDVIGGVYQDINAQR